MKGNLRFIILKALEQQERSGYGLMKHIGETLGKKPSPGSMYPLLESLHKEKLIKKKKSGRKDLYSLTKKGKQETKKFDKLKVELFTNMQKNIKMWGMLYNEDVSEHLQAIQAMKSDTRPFKEVHREAQAMKKALFSLYREKKIKKHQKQINKILKEATIKLKKLK